MSAPQGPRDKQKPPWVELKNGGSKLARLAYTSEYYTLEMTDFSNVWRERLESKSFAERQLKCSCPIKLQSATEIQHFGEFLSKHLPDAELRGNENGYTLKVGHTAVGNEISLEFELKQIDCTKASIVLAELALGMKVVIANLGKQLEQLNETIQEKNYHIRALADAISRSYAYVPRRYESSYDDAFKKKRNPSKTSFSELLHENWPSELHITTESTISPAARPRTDTAEEMRLKRRADLKKTTVRLKKSRLF